MENNNDITLEGSVATWRMDKMEGGIGGSYTGTFQFRTFLDPIRQLQAGKEYRSLLGELAVQASEEEGNLAFALVQLKHRILKSPPFWSSTLQDSGMEGNIGDLNVIAAVLDAAIRAENLFKEKMKSERDAVLNRSIKIAEELQLKQNPISEE
jgi:hypothetical protein